MSTYGYDSTRRAQARFTRAVRKDKARIVAHRPPEPFDWRLLGRRCVNAIVLHLIIAVLALLALSVRSAVYGDIHVHVPSSGAQR